MNSYTTRQAAVHPEQRRRDSLDALRETHLWIRAYTTANGRPPKTKDVAKGLNLSYSGAWGHIDRMITRGWVRRDEAGYIWALEVGED